MRQLPIHKIPNLKPTPIVSLQISPNDPYLKANERLVDDLREVSPVPFQNIPKPSHGVLENVECETLWVSALC